METVSRFFRDDMYDNYQNTKLQRVSRWDDEQRNAKKRRRSRPVEKKSWYSDGYPALRDADQRARAKREQDTINKPSSRRSQSLPHGASYNDRQTNKNKYRGTRARLRSTSVSSRTIYNDTSQRSRSNSVSSIRSRREVFTPSTVIYKTYTGIDTHDEIKSRVGSSYSVRSRIGSSRANPGGIVQKRVESVKPHLRESYVLNDIQSRSYKKMHETYDMLGTDSKWLADTMKRLKFQRGRVKNLYSNTDDVYRFLVDGSLKQFERLDKLTRKYESAANSKYQVLNPESPRLMEAKFKRLSERGLADTRTLRNTGRLKPIEIRPQVPRYNRVNEYMSLENGNNGKLYRHTYRSDNTSTRPRRIETIRNTQIPLTGTSRRSHPLKLKPLGYNLNKHGLLDDRQSGIRLAT